MTEALAETEHATAVVTVALLTTAEFRAVSLRRLTTMPAPAISAMDPAAASSMGARRRGSGPIEM